jgi:hypothetical protein
LKRLSCKQDCPVQPAKSQKSDEEEKGHSMPHVARFKEYWLALIVSHNQTESL